MPRVAPRKARGGLASTLLPPDPTTLPLRGQGRPAVSSRPAGLMVSHTQHGTVRQPGGRPTPRALFLGSSSEVSCWHCSPPRKRWTEGVCSPKSSSFTSTGFVSRA